MTAPGRPVLASSCARAATAAEARFRIDADIASAGIVAVVALDEAARGTLLRIAEHPWTDARFYTCEAAHARNGSAPDQASFALRSQGGALEAVDDVVGSAASVVLLAAAPGAAVPAAAVGKACAACGVPTAGFVLADQDALTGLTTALRPYAGILLGPAAEEDVMSVLSALRA